MGNLFFRLEPEDLEHQFRSSTLKRDIKQAIIVMMITMLTLIIFIVLELKFLGNEEIMRLWVPARAITVTILLLGIVLLWNVRSPERADKIILASGLVVILNMEMINLTRPDEFFR